MLPHFFVIGAQKAGSTFLLRCLADHPQIFMPRSEVPFFEDSLYQPERIDDFLAHFKKAGAGQIVGVKRPNLLGHPECPERLARHMPRLKLVVVLRHPVERAVSGYFHYMATGLIPVAPLEMGMPRILAGEYGQYPRAAEIIPFGRYHEHLVCYEQHFPREQFHVVLLDDIRRDAQSELRKAYRFLGVREDFQPPSAGSRPMPAVYSLPRIRIRKVFARYYRGWTGDGKYLARRSGPLATPAYWVDRTLDRLIWARLFPAPRPDLSAELSDRLLDEYRGDVERLESWLGRSLSTWKVPPPPSVCAGRTDNSA